MWYTYVYSIFHDIMIVFVRKYHNMVKKYIVGYLRNCEALYEIIDLVHEMLRCTISEPEPVSFFMKTCELQGCLRASL